MHEKRKLPLFGVLAILGEDVGIAWQYEGAVIFFLLVATQGTAVIGTGKHFPDRPQYEKKQLQNKTAATRNPVHNKSLL